MAIQGVRNMMQKEAEKERKTENSIDLHRVCYVTWMVTAVITGESGIVTKGLKENF